MKRLETFDLARKDAMPLLRTRCNTIGCQTTATTLVRMAEKRDPLDTWTEQLCDECAASYTRRPALIVSAL